VKVPRGESSGGEISEDEITKGEASLKVKRPDVKALDSL